MLGKGVNINMRCMRQSVSRSRCDSSSLYLWYDDYLLIYEYICVFSFFLFFFEIKGDVRCNQQVFVVSCVFAFAVSGYPFSIVFEVQRCWFFRWHTFKVECNICLGNFSCFLYFARLVFIFDSQFFLVCPERAKTPTPTQRDANIFEFNSTPAFEKKKKKTFRAIFLFCWCQLALIYGSLWIYRRSFVMT